MKKTFLVIGLISLLIIGLVIADNNRCKNNIDKKDKCYTPSQPLPIENNNQITSLPYGSGTIRTVIIE